MLFMVSFAWHAIEIGKLIMIPSCVDDKWFSHALHNILINKIDWKRWIMGGHMEVMWYGTLGDKYVSNMLC